MPDLTQVVHAVIDARQAEEGARRTVTAADQVGQGMDRAARKTEQLEQAQKRLAATAPAVEKSLRGVQYGLSGIGQAANLGSSLSRAELSLSSVGSTASSLIGTLAGLVPLIKVGGPIVLGFAAVAAGATALIGVFERSAEAAKKEREELERLRLEQERQKKERRDIAEQSLAADVVTGRASKVFGESGLGFNFDQFTSTTQDAIQDLREQIAEVTLGGVVTDSDLEQIVTRFQQLRFKLAREGTAVGEAGAAVIQKQFFDSLDRAIQLGIVEGPAAEAIRRGEIAGIRRPTTEGSDLGTGGGAGKAGVEGTPYGPEPGPDATALDNYLGALQKRLELEQKIAGVTDEREIRLQTQLQQVGQQIEATFGFGASDPIILGEAEKVLRQIIDLEEERKQLIKEQEGAERARQQAFDLEAKRRADAHKKELDDIREIRREMERKADEERQAREQQAAEFASGTARTSVDVVRGLSRGEPINPQQIQQGLLETFVFGPLEKQLTEQLKGFFLEAPKDITMTAASVTLSGPVTGGVAAAGPTTNGVIPAVGTGNVPSAGGVGAPKSSPAGTDFSQYQVGNYAAIAQGVGQFASAYGDTSGGGPSTPGGGDVTAAGGAAEPTSTQKAGGAVQGAASGAATGAQIGGVWGAVIGGILGALGVYLSTSSAKGNVFSHGQIVPFRRGGVVDSFSYFPMAGGRMGSMAEEGPEAIVPLKRGPDGRLGVSSSGGGSMTVFNVTTRDADSFRKARRHIEADQRRAERRRSGRR